MEDGSGGGLLQPVTNVSWVDCNSAIRRWGLRLPSEAQWEYGCRGGTASVYWSGNAKEDLEGIANLADEYARENGAPPSWQYETGARDGCVSHAPIGSLRGNRFGLHDVHGNVVEWCLDGFASSFYGKSPELDPVNPLPEVGSGQRVSRGGCFYFSAIRARSAYRYNYSPAIATVGLGLRPARVITTGDFTPSQVPSGR